jgi:MFS family permease
VRSLLRERDFLAYFIARQSSILAGSIETVAIGWQVFSLRHQPFDLGLVGLTLFLPQLLLALPAGVLADRFDRRVIVIAVACIEIVSLLLFVALVLSGSRSLAAYFSLIALIGIAAAIDAPAERSLLVGLVTSHQYIRATAVSSSFGQVLKIAGPALGGALIAIRTPLAFAAAALFYAIAAIGFAFLPKLKAGRDDAGVPLARSAIDGIRFIFSKKLVLGAISLDLFAVLFGGAVALLPVYAVQILHVGPTGFGALRAAPAVGAALVAAYLARHPISRRAGPMLMWCVAGFGVATIVFGLSKNVFLSLVALSLTGGFDMVSVVIRNVLVQLGTPDPMRGRVNAVENVFIGASNELGEFESGTVAALLGTEASVVLGGVATLVVIAAWAVLFPSLRSFDRLMPDAQEKSTA